MTAFTPFQAHAILPAASLNAALNAVDGDASAAATAAAKAETDAQTGITNAAAANAEADANSSAIGTLQTKVSADTSAAAQAEADAQTAITDAKASLQPGSIGVAGGPAGPLSSAVTLPLAQLGLKAGSGITLGSDGTIAATASSATGTGGFDAYVVFQGFSVDSSGNNVGGSPVILASKGVSSVDGLLTGEFQINLSPAAPSANYLVSAFGKFDVAANDATLALIAEPRRSVGTPTSTTKYLQIISSYQGGGTANGYAIFLYRVGIKFV